MLCHMIICLPLTGMARISFASSKQKRSFTSCSFQPSVTRSINSLTLVITALPRTVLDHLEAPLGIQGSSKTQMPSPEPTRHTIPSFNKSSPLSTLLHVYDIPGTSFAFKIEQLGKYRALRTCPHRVSGDWIKRQLCLERILKTLYCLGQELFFPTLDTLPNSLLQILKLFTIASPDMDQEA